MAPVEPVCHSVWRNILAEQIRRVLILRQSGLKKETLKPIKKPKILYPNEWDLEENFSSKIIKYFNNHNEKCWSKIETLLKHAGQEGGPGEAAIFTKALSKLAGVDEEISNELKSEMKDHETSPEESEDVFGMDHFLKHRLEGSFTM